MCHMLLYCKLLDNGHSYDHFKTISNNLLSLTDHSVFQENAEERPVSVNKQRLGAMGDRPARPSLIEQVLNQKRLVR